VVCVSQQYDHGDVVHSTSRDAVPNKSWHPFVIRMGILYRSGCWWCWSQ